MESLTRFFLGIGLNDASISTPTCTTANAHRLFGTYIVRRLLVLITLLVLLCLGLVWTTLLIVESLPSLTENLADLTYNWSHVRILELWTKQGLGIHTERDTRIFLADVVTLILCKKHVGRKATLWRVWVWMRVSTDTTTRRRHQRCEFNAPFFFFSALGLVTRLALVSLGMIVVPCRVDLKYVN